MKYFQTLFFLFLSSFVFSTTIIFVPLEESFSLSDLVLKGEVLEIYPTLDFEGQVKTRIVLFVEECLKGDVPAGGIFEFEAWGGKYAGYNVETVGEASYEIGEKVLVQLEEIEGIYHTLGLSFGKWKVKRDINGFEYLERDLSNLGMVNVSEEPITKVKYDEFKKLLKNKKEAK